MRSVKAGAAPRVRHVRHRQAGHLQEHHLGEIRRAAGARRRHGQLAGMLFDMRDELRKRVGRRRVRHEHEIVDQRHQRHRRKIGHGVVGQLAVEADVGRHGAGIEQNGVAVRIGACDILAAQIVAGTRLVLDKNLLMPHGRQLVGERARDDVGQTAGRHRHDDAHGFAWVSALRRLRAASADKNAGRDRLGDREHNQVATAEHVSHPRCLDGTILSWGTHARHSRMGDYQ